MSKRDESEDDGELSLGFSLPPISLPEIRLPERFTHVLPPALARRTAEPGAWALLPLAILVDGVDAALVLSGTAGFTDWVRVVTGTVLAVVLAGSVGLAYAWETLATATGFDLLTLAPSATVLVLARALR